MSAQGFLAAAPLVGLIINVMVHVAVSYAGPSLGILARAAVGLIAGAMATVVIGALGLVLQSIRAVDAGMLALLGIMTYLALAFGYFNFVNLNVTSLRIRLLRELLDRGPEGLTRDEIVRKYGAQTVLRLRLERLVRSGHLIIRGERYYMGGRRSVLLIAHLFSFLARIVLPSRESADLARSHA